MVTRLRNPDSKLSQLKNQQVAAAVHEANKGFKEGKEVSRAVDDEDDEDDGNKKKNCMHSSECSESFRGL